jgi:putative hydrolase of the HAD superfamily
MLTTIAFDADDTLWQNEAFFRLTQDQFAELLLGSGHLAGDAPHDHLMERLLAAEGRNLAYYGFGVKGFTLSMIETAIEVTNAKVSAQVIGHIVALGRDMLEHPIELLPHVRDTVTRLAHDYRVLLITKGDLLDQERKLAQSGLGDLFDGVEIVSNKTPESYAAIFARHGTGADQGMMVGNSMKSDVLPALSAGAWGVYVPHGIVWALEAADAPDGHGRFHALNHLGELPDLVSSLVSSYSM